jgi:ribonucleotide monophosphatase NagD (HAD superfamily)
MLPKTPDGVQGEHMERLAKKIARSIGTSLGQNEEEIAVVGDRIYTDIAIANGTKALSIMVLTGETKMEDLEQYDYRPDIILPSLAEITELL